MYVTFEGPIGAGKTTLATLLVEELGQGAQLLLENFKDNPFLADFYLLRDRWALPMQLDFIVSRHEQLSQIVEPESALLIADHSLEKDKIFAKLLLKGREINLYKRLALALGTICPNPDLVIYLDVETDVLLDRIRKRGRPYESHIDAEYLKSIDDAYGKYLSGLPSSKLLRIKNSNLDISSAKTRKKLLSCLLSKVSAAQVIHDSVNRRDSLSFD